MKLTTKRINRGNLLKHLTVEGVVRAVLVFVPPTCLTSVFPPSVTSHVSLVSFTCIQVIGGKCEIFINIWFYQFLTNLNIFIPIK